MQVLKQLRAETVYAKQQVYLIQVAIVRQLGLEIAAVTVNNQVVCTFNEPKYAIDRYNKVLAQYMNK